MKYRKPVVTPVTSIEHSTIQRRKASGTLGPDILEKLGKQLRGYYDGLIEPVPERFMKILRELDKPGSKGSSE